MKQKYYEWTLYGMRGRKPSKHDYWEESGTALRLKEAIQDASEALDQYKYRGFNQRYEVFEVKRELVGAQVYLPTQ
jgi:hypothetical protein